MSVCLSAWNNSAPTGRIYMKFDFGVFSESPSRLLKFHYNRIRIRITGTLHEDNYTFLSYLVQFFIEWETFQTKFQEKTRNIFYVQQLLFEKSCGLWDIAENYSTAPGRPQMTTRRMSIACWTHSEYVTLIAFPSQQWLHEGASVLRYKYTACCLVILCEYHCLLDSKSCRLVGKYRRFIGKRYLDRYHLDWRWRVCSNLPNYTASHSSKHLHSHRLENVPHLLHIVPSFDHNSVKHYQMCRTCFISFQVLITIV
jgi:hypothetical protein